MNPKAILRLRLLLRLESKQLVRPLPRQTLLSQFHLAFCRIYTYQVSSPPDNIKALRTLVILQKFGGCLALPLAPKKCSDCQGTRSTVDACIAAGHPTGPSGLVPTDADIAEAKARIVAKATAPKPNTKTRKPPLSDHTTSLLALFQSTRLPA